MSRPQALAGVADAAPGAPAGGVLFAGAEPLAGAVRDLYAGRGTDTVILGPPGAADEAAAERAVGEADERLGGVELMVWADIEPGCSFDELTPAAYEAYVGRHVHAAFWHARACLRRMVRRRRGRLVFVTSVVAELGDEDFLPGLAGGALNTLARSIAREEARRGIVASALVVGLVEDWPATHQEVTRLYSEQFSPLRRPVAAADVALAIASLASGPPALCSGLVARCDGGTL